MEEQEIQKSIKNVVEQVKQRLWVLGWLVYEYHAAYPEREEVSRIFSACFQIWGEEVYEIQKVIQEKERRRR